LTELKLTRISIEIVTPTRGDAQSLLAEMLVTIAGMLVLHPEASVDIHVCPEETFEEGPE